MASSEPSVEIRLFGAFEVRASGRVLHAGDWPRKKAAAILKRLALERRLVKDQVIDDLWPDSDPNSGASSLYKTLYELRQTLDRSFGPGAAAATLRFEDGVLSLAPSVWVDVEVFEQQSAPPPGTPSAERQASLEQALRLYRGDLLPDDLYLEWVQRPREALARRQREVRFVLAANAREARAYRQAIDLLLPLLAQDPADEPAHRELMRLYALAGQRHEALRQYQAAAEALADELGVPPAAETTALYQQIVNGELAPDSLPAGPSAPLPSADSPRPLFVGRAREMNELETRLQAATSGKGGVVFITGEAGQGKTSLMDEFAHRALARHPQLVMAAGACQALGGVADPYLPFRELIAMLNGDWQRAWLRGNMPAAFARRLHAIAPRTGQAIKTVAPDLLTILLPAARARSDAAADAPLLYQGQVFEQTHQLLRALAQEHPLLLLLDDLQWIDTASAGLLFFLGRQLANTAVLIVGAYRPSEIEGTPDHPHPLVAVIHELTRARGQIQFELSTADLEERRSFIDALLDSEPNRLDASFREALLHRTRGQPLFTVELLRTLEEQGQLARDEQGLWVAAAGLDWGILPARVEAVIAKRIGRLPPDLQQLLSLASVEGETFTVEILAQVLGIPVRAAIRALSQELDRRFRLVRELGSARLGRQTLTRFQFRHNLFQQYLVHQLGAAEQQVLHREIAASLEPFSADEPGILAVAIAHHYLAAGEAARAVPYLLQAGDDARRRLALDEAVQFYQRALDHWHEEDEPLRAETLRKLGESALTLGKSPAAILQFSAAEQVYTQNGDHTGAGAMHRLIGRSYWEMGDRARAMEHYQTAVQSLESEPDSAEMARAVSAMAQMHMLADEHDQAIEWGERALALARRTRAPDVIVHAMCTLGASLAVKGEVDRALAFLTESLDRADALSLPHDACRALTVLAETYLVLERYHDAQVTYERLLAYARKIHAELFEGVALAQLGYLDWWAGRWAAVLARQAVIQEWLAASETPQVPKVWACTMLGLMHNDLGQPERARSILTGSAEVARGASELQTTGPFLGQLARAAPSDAERGAIIQEFLVLSDRLNQSRYDVLPALMEACTWLAQASSGDRAALSRLKAARRALKSRQSAASLHEVQAVASGMRGEWARAVGDYQAAAAGWAALLRPYDQMRALIGLFEAAVRAGDPVAGSARRQAGDLAAGLAAELSDPEIRAAFLASPLVARLQMAKKGAA